MSTRGIRAAGIAFALCVTGLEPLSAEEGAAPSGGKPIPAEAFSRGHTIPAYEVAEPGAPRVTEHNLAQSERFWPFQVALLREQRVGPVRLPAGLPAVLIRVTAKGRVRLDWGSKGVHTHALGSTDLLERANAIRSGERTKAMPNVAWMIASKLWSPTGEVPEIRAFAETRSFGFLFVDPFTEDWQRAITALAALDLGPSVQIVLVPQGEGLTRPDLAEHLARTGSPGVVLRLVMARGATRALLGEAPAVPTLLRVSAEGRVLQPATRLGAAATFPPGD